MKKYAFLSIFLLLAVLTAGPVFSQNLDPTFGTGGVSFTTYPFSTTIPYTTSTSYGPEGFLRPDGGITILGMHTVSHIKAGAYSRMRLVTLTGDGNNPQYGDVQNYLLSTDAAQQPDGKVIAVGSTTTSSQVPPGNWFIERFNLNGQIDPTFATGVVTLDFGTDNDRAANVAVQDNGKILVSGSISGPNGLLTVVVRLNPDGTTMDPTFGPDGTGILYLYDNAILSQKMLLKPDGKILLLGTYYENPPQPYETICMFYQLNSNGSPDTSFGIDGVAYTIDSGQLIPEDIKARQNGEIFVLSTRKYHFPDTYYYDEQDIVLTKLDPTGSIDTTFGQSGRVINNDSPPYPRYTNSFDVIGSESAGALLIESTGNVLIATITVLVGPSRGAQTYTGIFQGKFKKQSVLLLKRYNDAGELIGKNFDGQTLRTDYVGGGPDINGMFEQPGNRIVVFGTHNPSYYDTSPGSGDSYNNIFLSRFSGISSVNNANNSYDYNLNGTADFSTYSTTPGDFSKWNVTRFDLYPWGMEGSPIVKDFGLEYDIPAPGDYDGDGVQDLAVYRDDSGDWFTRDIFLDDCLPMGCADHIHFGQPGDVPASGDFDGDGTTDRTVFRPSEGNWYILFANGSWTGLHFGQNGDLPVTGDYDDDGKSDVAVIRRENGFMTWYVLQSSNDQFVGLQFGLDSDKAVPADYTGDGRTDIGVWRPSEGNWYILSNYTDFSAGNWGLAGDIPEPADFDGDGKADFAVYRQFEGTHYARGSRLGNLISHRSGGAGHIPIPSAYVR